MVFTASIKVTIQLTHTIFGQNCQDSVHKVNETELMQNMCVIYRWTLQGGAAESSRQWAHRLCINLTTCLLVLFNTGTIL